MNIVNIIHRAVSLSCPAHRREQCNINYPRPVLPCPSADDKKPIDPRLRQIMESLATSMRNNCKEPAANEKRIYASVVATLQDLLQLRESLADTNSQCIADDYIAFLQYSRPLPADCICCQLA